MSAATRPLVVLFACVHNAGRSQMAAALLNHLADPAKARAISAGTQPAERVRPVVGEVMRAVGSQEPLDRRVALKTLHPECARNQDTVARFFNEAKVLSKLEHPSIVQVFDFGHTPDGTAYLVMEYLRGESLAHRLHDLAERRERLPPVAVLQFAW